MTTGWPSPQMTLTGTMNLNLISGTLLGVTDGVVCYHRKKDFGNHFHCRFRIRFALRDICFRFVSYRFDLIDLIVVVVV